MTSRSNNGFTLVEVLVAFAILAVVLGSVYGALSSGLRQERIAGDVTLRVLEARSILEGVGVETPVEEGTTGGTLASGEPWKLTIAEIRVDGDASDPNDNAGGTRLYHAVLLIEGDDGRTLNLETLKPLDPEPEP